MLTECDISLPWIVRLPWICTRCGMLTESWKNRVWCAGGCFTRFCCACLKQIDDYCDLCKNTEESGYTFFKWYKENSARRTELEKKTNRNTRKKKGRIYEKRKRKNKRGKRKRDS